MYLLFAPKEYLRERMTGLLAKRLDLLLASNWDELEAMTLNATCSVIAIDRFDNRMDVEHLRLFRQRHAVRPLIVVTQGDPSNIRKLSSISIDELVFLPEVERELFQKIHQSCSVDFLLRLAEEFKGERKLPLTLREALSYLLRSDQPPPSVEELALVIGCNRTTLNRQLRRAYGPTSGPTMKDVIDWVLLVRAILRKGPQRPWARIAEELGIHEHTLGRISRRLLRRPLSSIKAADHPVLVKQFLDDVAALLTSESSSDLQFIA